MIVRVRWLVEEVLDYFGWVVPSRLAASFVVDPTVPPAPNGDRAFRLRVSGVTKRPLRAAVIIRRTWPSSGTHRVQLLCGCASIRAARTVQRVLFYFDAGMDDSDWKGIRDGHLILAYSTVHLAVRAPAVENP